MSESQIIELTADIVSAHVANNDVASADLPALIRSVHAALSKTSEPLAEAAAAPEPAVSVRQSIKPDYIVCLEDGAKLKMLKRYLRTNFGMTPEDYRAKWNLPRDYPMVAPNYAEQRRTLAHKIGLGRKKVVQDVADVATTVKHGARNAIAAVENAVAPTAKPGRKPRTPKAATEAAQAHLAGAETADA